MEPIYLDYAATTPVRPEVRVAMFPLLDGTFGNPSSVHRWGREAKVKLEEARARIASSIGASPLEIFFTRGGTEADNLAILGRSRHLPKSPVACSAIEHRAVLAPCRRAEAERCHLDVIAVDGRGIVDPDAIAEILPHRPSVVSVMWANNEVGAIQPVEALAAQCAEAGIVFHVDAIQAFGKLRVRVDEVPISMMSLSAHKIGGPKGVGALYIRKGVTVEPLVYGGGHERGMRAGTEDVAGAVGFGVAADLAAAERQDLMPRLASLRDRLETGLRERVPDLIVNAAGAERLPSILNVSVPGANTELMLVMLDLEGLAVSSGSACSSGGVTPSHVLTAMGLPADIAGPSVRFSLGRETLDQDIDRVLDVFPPLMERLRAPMSL